MDRGQAFNMRLHARRQSFIGAVHIRKGGIAAANRRYLGDVENAAHRRLWLTTEIGVPDLASRGHGVFIGLDYTNLGMAENAGTRGRMHDRVAEAAAEFDVLFYGNFL